MRDWGAREKSARAGAYFALPQPLYIIQQTPTLRIERSHEAAADWNNTFTLNFSSPLLQAKCKGTSSKTCVIVHFSFTHPFIFTQFLSWCGLHIANLACIVPCALRWKWKVKKKSRHFSSWECQHIFRIKQNMRRGCFRPVRAKNVCYKILIYAKVSDQRGQKIFCPEIM
jgi:hypothetical protein